MLTCSIPEICSPVSNTTKTTKLVATSSVNRANARSRNCTCGYTRRDLFPTMEDETRVMEWRNIRNGTSPVMKNWPSPTPGMLARPRNEKSSINIVINSNGSSTAQR